MPHYLCFCFTIDLPCINPFDSAVNDRLNIITYSKRQVENPTSEFEFKKDDNINSEIATDKFKITFLFLILQYYEEFIRNGKKEIIPDEVKNNKTEWVGENVDKNVICRFQKNTQ